MPETPHKVTLEIDAAIDELNARWNLSLPKLHGVEARRSGNDSDIGRKCSLRIRHFCWKGNVSIKRIIEDFEERAAQKCSDWRYKPGQVKGTLPSLPVTKSFLKRDAISKSKLDPQNCFELTKILVELLEDEYKLSKDSDVYQRTSLTSPTTGSKSTSFTTVPSTRSSYTTAPESKENRFVKSTSEDDMARTKKAIASKKRGSAYSPVTTTSKRAKTEPRQNQLTFSQLDRRRSARLSASRDDISSTVPGGIQPIQSSNPNERSFDTVDSDQADPIFSDHEIEPASSNNTSILSGPHRFNGSQSNFGGTQIEAAIRDDLAIHKSFEAANNTASQPLDQLLSTLSTTGPFKPVLSYGLPRNLDYWYTFELHRLSLHLGCAALQAFNMISQECGMERPTFSDFWDATKKICRAENISLLRKSGVKAWNIDENTYIDTDGAKSISFSGRLDFPRGQSRDLFEFSLSPMEIDKSCRFHRRFGPDRFLVLDIPSFAPEWPKTIPAKLKAKFTQPGEVHDKIFDWLGTNDLYIAGRIWRLFYVEPKDVTKKKRKVEGTRLKAHLFAVNGFDFAGPKAPSSDTRQRPISLIELVQWHIPLSPNRQSSVFKLFARMALGLSKTTPSVVIKPSQFIYISDKLPTTSDGVQIKNGEVMTDGNARISYALAQAIWRTICKDTSDIPSVFQARIGGAKGTWTVDYSQSYPERGDNALWIEVSDSQLKIKPHPCEREDADDTQRTFEIVKYSHICTSANLNTQLITILENRSVPRNIFAELIMAERKRYYQDLKESLEDPVKLRVWRQMWHPSRSNSSEMTWCGDLPDAKEDELDMLLEAGFDPRKYNHIAECLPRIVRQSLETKNEKLWINVPYSTNMFCVPDYAGVLEAGEIQFNPSQSVSDFPEYKFEGRTVLVARNPAHLPSDIQAVKCVYRPELRHIKDVAIFSTKGQSPLAGMLSGGDYDGDTVCMIWDEQIVQHFQNAVVPKLPSKHQCGVESETLSIEDVFTVEQPTYFELNKFMRKCSWFNGIGSRLGEVTKLFEKLVYADSDKMTSPEALQLAALAGYLVDGAKAGDLFSSTVWRKLHQDIFRKHHLLQVGKLAYDDETAISSDRKNSDGLCLNVLDYLKFDVALGETEKILTDFAQRSRPKPELDMDLRKAYDAACIDAGKAKGETKQALIALLKELKTQVERIATEWARRMAENEHLKTQKELPRDAVLLDYNKLCNELAADIREIRPLKTACYIYDDFDRHGGGRGSLWARLRASCIYSIHYKKQMPWKLVGRDLCRIKLDATEDRDIDIVYGMTGRMRAGMKMDIRKHKILTAVNDDDIIDAALAETSVL